MCVVRGNNYEREGSNAKARYDKNASSMRTGQRVGKCVLLSNGCKKSNKSEDGGMRRVDTAEQYHKENEGSKEKWTSNTARQGNDESDDH